MNEKYDIRFWQDSQYAVYNKDDIEGSYVFKGTLEEVNAWINLRNQGFQI